MIDALFPLSEVAHDLTGFDAEISADGIYRYTLTRVWNIGLPLAMFVMLNPSTADATQDDPTIRRCRWFAEREGCGGLIVVNLFGLRATNPQELAKHPDPVGKNNASFIRQSLSRNPAVVIAAWGAHPFAAVQAQAISQSLAVQLAHRGMRLKCLGITQGGQPRHPLYLKKNTPLVTYRPPQPKKGKA